MPGLDNIHVQKDFRYLNKTYERHAALLAKNVRYIFSFPDLDQSMSIAPSYGLVLGLDLAN